MDGHEPARRGRWGPEARDAALRRTRRLARLLVVAAAALSGVFAVVAAQAFKGHGRARRPAGAAVRAAQAASAGRTAAAVAPPQRVPSIAGQQASLQPPATTPAPAPAQPTPAPPPPPAPPPVSGGS